jgi:hypothetical protein
VNDLDHCQILQITKGSYEVKNNIADSLFTEHFTFWLNACQISSVLRKMICPLFRADFVYSLYFQSSSMLKAIPDPPSSVPGTVIGLSSASSLPGGIWVTVLKGIA